MVRAWGGSGHRPPWTKLITLIRAVALRKPRALVMRALTWAVRAAARALDGPASEGDVDGRLVPGQRRGELGKLGDPAVLGPGDDAAQQLLAVLAFGLEWSGIMPGDRTGAPPPLDNLPCGCHQARRSGWPSGGSFSGSVSAGPVTRGRDTAAGSPARMSSSRGERNAITKTNTPSTSKPTTAAHGIATNNPTGLDMYGRAISTLPTA